MILADMSVKRRHVVLETMLEAVLQDLPGTVSTGEVVKRLCAMLETKEQQLVARWILVRAPQRVEAAHTGETYVHFGRPMQKWVWSPKEKRVHSKAAAKAAPEKWEV
jgi:hypothetical protein